MIERALKIAEREYGEDHVQTASMLLSLSSSLGISGQYLEAKTLAERAITIEEREYGWGHVHVLHSFSFFW